MRSRTAAGASPSANFTATIADVAVGIIAGIRTGCVARIRRGDPAIAGALTPPVSLSLDDESGRSQRERDESSRVGCSSARGRRSS